MNLNQKAIQLLEENRFDEALHTFREAVRESRNVQSLNNLAWIMTYEENDYQTALELLVEAVAMNPISHFPYSLLGEVFLHLKKWGEARNALEKAIEMQPTKISYHNLGAAHYHLGNKEEAGHFFRLGSEPSDIGLYYHIKCLIELGKVDEAKTLLDSFSEEDEEFVGEVDLGDLYAEIGCFQEANTWFEKGWKVFLRLSKRKVDILLLLFHIKFLNTGFLVIMCVKKIKNPSI